jgi:arylsulfatase A
MGFSVGRGLLVLGIIVAVADLSWAEPRRPNIVFVLADDLGYGDLGCYGQTKIRTPRLDRLAAEGIRFTQHYSGNNVCAPSRCVLMTGKHPGHAYIRDNRGGVGRNPQGEVKEGQEPVPAGALALPLELKRRGYVLGAFGKWGLGGMETTGNPLKQGFDRFFGYNCQAVAHNAYPVSLWDNNEKRPLSNPAFPAHQAFPADADPAAPASYARYSGPDYAPDLILTEAISFLKANRDQPFFLFFPTIVPHLALQVPQESLDDYAGAFEETPYPGNKGYLPHRTPRAAYAAMVSRLDAAVGQLVDTVAELGLEEETIFVFTSDNGPLYDGLGGTDDRFFDSAGGLRGRKGSNYEGGIRVPCLVRWKGRLTGDRVSDRVTGFEDWLPTLLELSEPGERPVGKRDISLPETPAAGIDGLSFARNLYGEPQAEREFLYRETPGYGGQQSVRMGDWKAIRTNLSPRPRAADQTPGTIELYNLRSDPHEKQDVASTHPDEVARLQAVMKREHTPSDLFPIKALDAPAP